MVGRRVPVDGMGRRSSSADVCCAAESSRYGSREGEEGSDGDGRVNGEGELVLEERREEEGRSVQKQRRGEERMRTRRRSVAR
jgi:hypothetical protein